METQRSTPYWLSRNPGRFRLCRATIFALFPGVLGTSGAVVLAGSVKLESVLVVDFEGLVLMFLAKEAIANR